jgi:hypothetical protein
VGGSGSAIAVPGNGWNRRVSPVAVRPGEGRLTESTAGIPRGRRELVFMPLCGHCRQEQATARSVGNPLGENSWGTLALVRLCLQGAAPLTTKIHLAAIAG